MNSNEIERKEFAKKMKIDTYKIDTMIKRNNFLKEIDGNEELLKKLTVDRLIILKKYYDGVIEQNNEEIEKLKKLV